MSSCHCHRYGEEEEDEDGYYELNNYDDDFNAEDEGDDRPEVGNDTDTDMEINNNTEYVRLYEADANNRSQLRDEFIYTQVFNNHKVPTETPMDFSLGSIEEWGLTCDTFNNVEKDLTFATIYIIYDSLVCNNIHPFLEMNHLTDLFDSHVIHD